MLDESTLQVTPAEPAADSSTTPTSTDPQVTPDASQTPANPATTEFLRVNDRTVYKNAEDARKGYEEAQQRITALSEWEKVVKDYQVSDPKTLAELFNELIEVRNAKTASAQPPSQDTMARAVAGDPVAFAKLPPEWQQTAKYLRDEAGFVTKDAIAPLEQRMNAFEQSRQEQHVESARTNGASVLTNLMAEDKIPATDRNVSYMEAAIEKQITRSSYDSQGRIIRGSDEDRFINGTPADRQEIVTRHYAWFREFGESVAKSKSDAYVKEKQAAVSSQPRPLPPSNSPSTPTVAKTQGKGLRDPGINKEVASLFESLRQKQSAG